MSDNGFDVFSADSAAAVEQSMPVNLHTASTPAWSGTGRGRVEQSMPVNLHTATTRDPKKAWNQDRRPPRLPDGRHRPVRDAGRLNGW